MDPQRFAKIKEVFLAATGRSPETLETFLSEACAGDEELRREVEALLEHHRETETPVMPSQRRHEPPPGIDNYRILQRVGEGGMGEVWEAEQERPVRRRVALKLIKWGMDTKAVVARFESERQALALMSHPNIARVFEAGSTSGGRPFFAMEFVRGVPVTDYCDSNRLNTEERLRLFVQICSGVQHAHQKGVIHRDIKPGNVLVALEDGQPVPKIIDFGVAKATSQRLTERTVFTELGQWIGTPEYMSPEQAGLTGLDVDTRTDVYSLGVLLYELLVGVQPFDSETLRNAGFDEMRRRIREDEPPRPSTRASRLGRDSDLAAQKRRTDGPGLVHALRGDLDWIVMRTLEKDRTRRYASPSELAADIERHLRDEAVLASPPSTPYRLRKFARRHWVAVAAGSLVMLALVLGLAAASVGLVRARRAERRANEEARAARQVSRFLASMFDGLNPEGAELGQAASATDMLDQGAARIGEELADQPLVRARLMTSMGNAYTALGEYKKALPLLEQALAIRRQHLSDRHLDVATTLQTLSWTLYWLGDYQQARDSLSEALAIRERELGPDHLQVAQTASSLGFHYWRAGEYDRARTLLDRALAIQEAEVGLDDLSVAGTLYIRGILRVDDYNLSGGRADLERALAIREPTLGPDHTLVGWALHDLGRALSMAGDLETAKPLIERSLAIQERALGPDHVATAFPLNNLANLLIGQGADRQARPLAERALAIREKALGPEHPDVAWSLNTLARIHLRAGDLATARRLYERAGTILARALGPRHPELATMPCRIGFVDYRAGDLAASREGFERCLELRLELFGPDHPALAPVNYGLGCLAALLGEPEEALRLLRLAVKQGYAGRTILDDPDLASLRGDPEFEVLVSEVRRRLGED